jgi:hypothetical protein
MNAQEVDKKSAHLNHLIGIDVGYSDYSNYVKSIGEVNLDYIFNPYYFCVKSQLGFAPATNFGTLTKAYISIGFSTKTDKVLSWHLLTGIGGVFPSKSCYDMSFSTNNIFLETGFYIRPFKNKRSVFGLNTVLMPYTIYYNNSRWWVSAPSLNINVSYNIKLNK